MGNWDTQNVTNMGSMFAGTTSLSKLKVGNLSLFNGNVWLPVIDTYTGKYTGRWLDEETGIAYDLSGDFMYSYNGTNPGTYVWESSQLTIKAVNSTLFIGNHWNPEDNFVSATNQFGSPIDFSDITVVQNDIVDTSKEGVYRVSYESQGVVSNITVTVVKDQSTIKVKDTTITVGDKWTAADNFVSATDRYGHPIELTGLKVTESVSTDKAGKYKVVYTWMVQDVNGNETGETVSADAYVTVLDKKKDEPIVKPTDKPTAPSAQVKQLVLLEQELRGCHKQVNS